jgi:hypothetical protein
VGSEAKEREGPLPGESNDAKPRELQFRGLFVETVILFFKQNCHLDWSVPGFPATQPACAVFSKESRMKFANATISTGNPG